MMKIGSNILFKTMTMKSAVKSKFILLFKSKSSARMLVTNEEHFNEF